MVRRVLQPEGTEGSVLIETVNRGYPQFNQNLPNLAKMTNPPPPRRRREVWKFDPFYTFIVHKVAGCDGNKNGNKLSHCVNYWPLIAKFRRTDSSAASFSIDIQPLDLFQLRLLKVQLNPYVESGVEGGNISMFRCGFLNLQVWVRIYSAATNS